MMLDILTQAASKAGELAQAIRRNSDGQLDRMQKSEWDFATEADLKCQDFIVRTLSENFPNIPIVAEEQEDPRISSSDFFVVDPIDGTTPYNHGRDTWGITIAYIKDYKPQCGVMVLPDRNVVVRAERGRGCFLNDKKIIFNHTQPLIRTVVGMELGPWLSEDILQNTLNPIVVNCQGIIATLSAINGIVEVLERKSGVYINCNILGKGAKIWDFAAGSLAIEEAGGSAVAPNGQPLQWNEVYMEMLCTANKDLLKEIRTHAKTVVNLDV
jgi:fructose-1,6-bisphosphatase/inositol monophosphatase family enzyme